MEKTLGIGQDSFVTIAYSIFADGESTPVDLGESETRTTLSYVHGYGIALPVLEKGLEGEEQGTQLMLEAEPEEAFGPHEPEGVFEVDKDGFDGASDLKVGDELLAEGPDGNMIMRVLAIRDDCFVVDTNHPLAGKRVRFDVEIVSVREATDEEIADAQDEAEDLADDGGCCEHDHGDGKPHHHHHDPPAEPLVQLGKAKKD